VSKWLILTYHAVDSRASVTSVSPALFQWQMESLAAQNLTGISLADAFDHLERTGSFPQNSVVLTFDDGYLDMMSEVLPVTGSLGFSATVFIISGTVGMNAAQARAVNRDIDRDMLGWSQLEELVQSGFEIGSHTLRHPSLTPLPVTEVERELGESKHKLQQRLQVPVNSFAYPYGDLNQAVRNVASTYYSYGCTTRLGPNSMAVDPLQLKRVDAYYLSKPGVFLRVCDGGLEGYLHLRQSLRDFKKFFK
jgi:peptidoglycan/xylan/chitin deacetylase (PgdA/CDA1 family)